MSETGPAEVIWDMTYACPLRCVHCYSESGRRPARRLDRAELLRVADALVSLRPAGVALSGGEPLLVPGIVEVAARIGRAGIPVALYTSGWTLRPEQVDDLARVFARISVSVDGATAAVHDRVRGRAGSFDRAMAALALLDAAETPVPFGIDFVAVRSNFHQLERLCTDVAPRFPRLGQLWLGASVPSGLASRVGFAEHELLTDEQARAMGGAELPARLRSLAPATVGVGTSDNLTLQMHPDHVANGTAFRAMQIEPDGEVRAMAIYEGTVGNIRTEDPMVLWNRAVA
ncbi:MAG TPA: radical SAM protein, partial [Micromonosporaceae bacterium]|nr:radical SAM protein [Micromonosporaceae bacterium]